MFLKGWTINNMWFVQSKIIKIRACNQNMFFEASNHINYGKVTPKWLQQVSQKSAKIDINQCWDIQGPSWVHPCTQQSPEWCQSGASRPQNASKMVSKSNKINNFEWRPTWNQFSICLKQINSWSHSDCNFQACWCKGGRRQGRSLKIYTYILYIYIILFRYTQNIE